jgi:TRAP-type uncharacterized transport system substrate-binding protein
MVDALPFRPANAPDIRTFAIAQMAVAMSADRTNPARPFREVRVEVGTSIEGSFRRRLIFASDMPDVAGAVVRGEVDLGAFNPSAYLTMACRGVGPFAEPLPLRAIGVMPSLDWMVFAVSERLGVSSLVEVRERHVPLRLSVRSRPADSTRFVVDQALGALGFSLADIQGWGGSVQLVDGPRDPARMQAIRDGSIDAVFDEGISGWGHVVLEHGMRFLQLGPEVESRLAGLGWRRLPVSRAEFPEMREDVVGVSFSGWPLFTRADLADDLAYEMAKALDAARPIVPWDSESTVELRDLCVSSDASPLDAPLHQGAARYYREQGAL